MSGWPRPRPRPRRPPGRWFSPPAPRTTCTAGPDLADTIRRLQAYQEAGADVLYAPGLTSLADIAAVVTSVDRPVNVLTLAGAPTVPQLAEAGVRRISVGSAFSNAALGALVTAARELREQGTYGFLDQAATGRAATREAFHP